MYFTAVFHVQCRRSCLTSCLLADCLKRRNLSRSRPLDSCSLCTRTSRSRRRTWVGQGTVTTRPHYTKGGAGSATLAHQSERRERAIANGSNRRVLHQAKNRTIRLHTAVERTAYLRSCRNVRLRPSTRSHRGTVAHRGLLAPRLVDCRAMRESGRLQEVRGSWQPVVPACADRPCYEPPRIMNSATLWKAK